MVTKGSFVVMNSETMLYSGPTVTPVEDTVVSSRYFSIMLVYFYILCFALHGYTVCP